MKTGLLKAGFFLNIPIPPYPFIFKSLSFWMLLALIPPKAKILILLFWDKILNLFIPRKFFDFFIKKSGDKKIALHFCEIFT